MCGNSPRHGFHRSNTDALMMPGSPSYAAAGNRSPIFGGLQSSSGGCSSWSLQRKPSYEQPLGQFGFGTSPPMDGPIVFVAPQLTQETLLEVIDLHWSGPFKDLSLSLFSQSPIPDIVNYISANAKCRFGDRLVCFPTTKGKVTLSSFLNSESSFIT